MISFNIFQVASPVSPLTPSPTDSKFKEERVGLLWFPYIFSYEHLFFAQKGGNCCRTVCPIGKLLSKNRQTQASRLRFALLLFFFQLFMNYEFVLCPLSLFFLPPPLFFRLFPKFQLCQCIRREMLPPP